MIITTNEDLKKYCSIVSKDKYIAVDTEFYRGRCYHPKLSLIQIASEQCTFAVDVLCELDYQPLVSILCNKKIIKVIHAAKQDMELLYHCLKIIVYPVFDTQIAADFDQLGANISYELLIKHYLGIKISKDMQVSNWLQRPLSNKQVQYALNDVRHLHTVYKLIVRSLHTRQRISWVHEECIREYSKKLVVPHCDNQVKVFVKKIMYYIKKEDLNIRIIYAMRLFQWRENVACNLDKLRIDTIPDHVIVDIINELKIENQDHINCTKDVNNTLNPTIDNKVNNATNKTALLSSNIAKILKKFKINDIGLDTEVLRHIISQDITAEENRNMKLILYDKMKNICKNEGYYLLKALLFNISRKINISESCIASNIELLKFSNMRKSLIIKGWRCKVFGSYAKDLLEGKLQVSIDNKQHLIMRHE